MSRCFYSIDVGGDPSYYLLGPLKVEVAHGEPHPILVFRDIITDKVTRRKEIHACSRTSFQVHNVDHIPRRGLLNEFSFKHV